MPGRSRDPRGPVGAFVLGLAAALLLLEIVLRLLGAACTPSRAAQRDGAAFTILCIGDSFVYGLGAPPDKSYPVQLEALLKERTGLPSIRVINAGMPGRNLCQIYHRFERDVDALHPDLVILLGGMICDWNLYGYHEYREGNTLRARLADQLDRVRVYRLARSLLAAGKRRSAGPVMPGDLPEDLYVDLGEGNEPCASARGRELFARGLRAENEGRFDAAVEAFTAVTRLEPGAAAAHRHLGEIARLRGDADGETAHLLTYLRRNDRNPFVYAALGKRCMERNAYADAFRYYSEGLTRAAAADGKNACAAGIAALYEEPGAAELRPQVKEFMRLLRGRAGPDTAALLASLLEGKEAERRLYEWRRYDIRRIAALCRERGTGFILLNYPEMDASYSRIAREGGLAFVDNRAVFARLSKGLPQETYMDVVTNHCNAAGYRLMAQNVAARVLELGYLKEGGKGDRR